MKDTFLKVMPWVLEEEGGYVDHPKDPGGATNLGLQQSIRQGTPNGRLLIL